MSATASRKTRKGTGRFGGNRNARLLIAGACVLTLCSGYLVWRALSASQLERAAAKILRCIETADAHCVWNYSHEVEREQLQLTQSKMGLLLRQYASPVLSKLTRVGGVEMQKVEDQGALLATQAYVRPDGVRVALGIRVVPTPDGPRAPLVVSETLLSLAHIKYLSGDAGDTGAAKVRAYRLAAEQDAPGLSRIGIHGFYRDEPEGFVGWDAWAEECKARLERLERRGASRR
jgi:hypothetical protein